jgi:hypothetical protein
MNTSAIDSSMLSPPGGDSLQGGTLHNEGFAARQFDHVNSAGMGSGMALEYSEDNIAL